MTLIKGVLVPADDDKLIEAVEFDRDDYRNIQQYVGGNFEVVEARGLSIWLNEDGKGLGLPLNKRGTEFLYAHRTEFVGYDVLVGDVLILGTADSHGNTTSAPDHLIQRMVG